MSFQVAIVGAGRMGRERGRAASQLGAQVLTVCDPDIDRAATLANGLGASAIAGLEGIDWSDLDAVFVCTPPAARGLAEFQAIGAGVPLMIEKPLGLSAADCVPIIEALRERKVVNAVGYMNRYRESVLSAREQLAAAKPIGATFHWLGTQYRVPWWLKADQSGGPLNEQCTHFVDLCQFLIGDITEVHAIGRPLPDYPEVDGTVAMTLRFHNGQIASGLYSCEASEKQISFEIFLPDRSICLKGWDLKPAANVAGHRTISREDIFVREVSSFFNAIRTQDSSGIHSNFETALKTQIVMDALRCSLISGHAEEIADQMAHQMKGAVSVFA